MESHDDSKTPFFGTNNRARCSGRLSREALLAVVMPFSPVSKVLESIRHLTATVGRSEKSTSPQVQIGVELASSVAWIAVDEKTAALLEVPEIKGRYYTAQILDEWGEVITNINERNDPSPENPEMRSGP